MEDFDLLPLLQRVASLKLHFLRGIGGPSESLVRLRTTLGIGLESSIPLDQGLPDLHVVLLLSEELDHFALELELALEGLLLLFALHQQLHFVPPALFEQLFVAEVPFEATELGSGFMIEDFDFVFELLFLQQNASFEESEVVFVPLGALVFLYLFDLNNIIKLLLFVH